MKVFSDTNLSALVEIKTIVNQKGITINYSIKTNKYNIRKENNMEMRKWLMQELEYALEDHIEMIDIINNTSDESLEEILDAHFAECIFNIQSNYTFLRMIITRKKANHIGGEPDESIMTNDELDKFFKEHVKQLMGLIPII